jgi:hypothetical protein
MIIGNDTVAVMKRDHAKDLARERVDYWYLQETSRAKDTLIDDLREGLQNVKRENELWKELSESKDKRIDLHKKIEDSQERTISVVETQVKSLKKTTFVYILLTVAAVTGLILK